MREVQYFNKLDEAFGERPDELDPMVSVISYYLEKEPIYILQNMLDGDGFGGDNTSFSFPTSYEPWEKDEEGYFEEGVKFSWGRLGVIVDNKTFAKYLSKGVDAFGKLYPKYKEQADELLAKIKEKYVGNKDVSKYKDTIIKTLELDD